MTLMANINEIPKAELAKAEVAEEAARPVTNDEKRHFTAAQIQYYAALEARGVSGAPSLATKSSMLDTKAHDAAHPEFHHRFVNTANRDKADSRQASGYETVPEAEGGRRLGDFVLMRIPRELKDARVAAEAKLTQARLGSFRRDVQAATEAARRQLIAQGYEVKRSLFYEE